MTPVERISERLQGIRRTPDGMRALCPAHDDHEPSLSLSEADDGSALVYCHAGCKVEDVLGAIVLTTSALYSTTAAAVDNSIGTYEYRDEAGRVLRQVVRQIGKRFRQRRPDGRGGWEWNTEGVRHVLYRLPELLATPPSALVFVVEGEKDVHALEQIGLTATTNSGGAGKWKPEYNAFFADRSVVILPDNDAPGRRHAEQVADALRGVAARVRVLALPGLPDHGDVSDWLGAGHTRVELLDLVERLADGPPRDAGVGILLSQVAPECVEWLWTGRLPRGKVTLLEGDPDEGKSCLAIDLAARLTTGRPLPGDVAPLLACGVVFVTAEDGLADTIRPRFDAAGGDATRVCTFPLDELPILDTRGLAKIERAIARVDAALVVIDPLMAFLPATVDAYKDQHVRATLAPLHALATRTKASILLIRHLTKNRDASAKYRGGGSIGILGAARSAMLAVPNPESPDQKILATVKSNLAARTPSLTYALRAAGSSVIVEWIGESMLTADAILSAARPTGNARSEAGEFLRSFLADGARPGREVETEARRLGIAPMTLRRAREDLCESRRLGDRQMWSLTNVGAPANLRAGSDRATGAGRGHVDHPDQVDHPDHVDHDDRPGALGDDRAPATAPAVPDRELRDAVYESAARWGFPALPRAGVAPGAGGWRAFTATAAPAALDAVRLGLEVQS